MKYRFLFFILLIYFPTSGQQPLKEFFRLSAAEKCWTITHLLKAKKAYRISREAREESKRMVHHPALDSFEHGGMLDAFRHAYWMACLGREIGCKAARKLGQAHEKGNYRDFKKGKKEDGALQDATAVMMDLHNNEAGLQIALASKHHPLADIREMVVQAVTEGKMKIMKRDSNGVLCDCEGNAVQTDKRGANDWQLPYCLIPSNGH